MPLIPNSSRPAAPSSWLFFCLAIACLALFPGFAFAQVGKEITISYDSLANGLTTHGYVDHHFTITNKSKTQAHTVRIVAGSAMSGSYLQELSREVVVPADSSASMTMYQPALRTQWYNGIHVYIDGSASTVDVGAGTPQHAQSQMQPNVLISRDAGTLCMNAGIRAKAFEDRSSSTPRYYGGFSASSQIIATISDLPAQAWPTHWLAYSRFDGLIMNGDEWDRLPPGAKEAIERYLEMGGRLAFHGLPARTPEAWGLSKSSSLVHVGFGSVMTLGFKTWSTNTEDWKLAEEQWRQAYAPLAGVRGAAEANNDFPVIERMKLPTKGLIALVVLFTLGVGPANILLLGRRGKKIWMLWTVPAISVVTSLLIFAYATFGDGWQGQGRTSGITFLNGNTQHASTLAWTGYYSPLTPSNGLSFSPDAELSLQAENDIYNNQGGTPKYVDWTSSQHFYSGWITARVPAIFEYRKSETRRERITVQTNASGALTVTNALGAPIKAAYVRTGMGTLYVAKEVAEGETKPLDIVKNDGPFSSPSAETIPSLYSRGDWFNLAAAVESGPDAYTPNSGYVAILDGNPFVEDAIGSLQKNNKSCVVIGTFKAQDLPPLKEPRGASSSPETQP